MSEKIKFHLLLILTMAILSIAPIVLLSIGWGGEESYSESDETEKYKFLGAVVCMECHAKEELGEQFQVWTGTKHARSYLQL